MSHGTRTRYPRLPGEGPRATSTRRAAPSAESVHVAPLLDPILCLLADRQPRGKGELHEILHVSEALVYRALQQLRRAGLVKAVGRRLMDRQWALASYRAPRASFPKGQAPAHADAMTAITHKPAPPPDSWWTRPEFRYPGVADG